MKQFFSEKLIQNVYNSNKFLIFLKSQFDLNLAFTKNELQTNKNKYSDKGNFF